MHKVILAQSEITSTAGSSNKTRYYVEQRRRVTLVCIYNKIQKKPLEQVGSNAQF